jgi:putative transposase
VDSVLAQADEHYTRQWELRRHGYDLGKIAKKAAEIYGLEGEEVLARGGQKRRVNGRSLFCYWAVHELGVALTDLAWRLKMSPAGVGYAAQRGEAIANENDFRLL